VTLDGSLDTNVLLRVVIDDIPGQTEQAVALLSQLGKRYQVADAVWIEVACALEHHYAMSRADVSQAITSLLDLDAIAANRSTMIQTCTEFRAHARLTFVDCYLVAQARGASAIPLYTFDRKLAKQLPNATAVPNMLGQRS